MELNIRYDPKNDKEIINVKGFGETLFSLGTNFINFISLDIENILNNEIISNLSENNYKKIISKITTATDGVIIPEIIDTNIFIDISRETINIQQIKEDLTEVLKAYNKFKKLTDFCYFNNEFKDMTPFQKYIYYLHKFEIEKVMLPKQTIISFGLKPKKAHDKLLKNDDILIMLQKNSPFFYFSYNCSTIDEYLTASFLQLIENNYSILKCNNCGKYFIAYNRSDTLYCDRTSPQNDLKTCKKYAIEQAWQEKIKDETDWHCLYRRVYQSLQMKARRNKGHKPSEQKFEYFKEESKKWKKEIKEHTKTDKEFVCWLQSFRQK